MFNSKPKQPLVLPEVALIPARFRDPSEDQEMFTPKPIARPHNPALSSPIGQATFEGAGVEWMARYRYADGSVSKWHPVGERIKFPLRVDAIEIVRKGCEPISAAPSTPG